MNININLSILNGTNVTYMKDRGIKTSIAQVLVVEIGISEDVLQEIEGIMD